MVAPPPPSPPHQQTQAHQATGKYMNPSPNSLLHEYLVQQQQARQQVDLKDQAKPHKPTIDHHRRHHEPTSKVKAKTLAYELQQRQLAASSPLHQSQFGTSPAPSIYGQVQRKLFAFFSIYATLVVVLYLTYALVAYYQQQRDNSMYSASNAASRQLHLVNVGGDAQMQVVDDGQQQTTADQSRELAASNNDKQQLGVIGEFQLKLENKILLLERYIDVIAMDLEATKIRLKEREKCACSISCSFNGTQFHDKQTWQQKCDTCTCQAGKISCAPRKCPKLTNDDCDDPIKLPGQCCATCMKKCKVNKTFVRHGHKFKPLDSNGFGTKQCKCHDGLIKCEPIINSRPIINSNISRQPLVANALDGNNNLQQQQQQQQREPNKTVNEYLKLISQEAGAKKEDEKLEVKVT